jgi:hypothetical protein
MTLATLILWVLHWLDNDVAYLLLLLLSGRLPKGIVSIVLSAWRTLLQELQLLLPADGTNLCKSVPHLVQHTTQPLQAPHTCRTHRWYVC